MKCYLGMHLVDVLISLFLLSLILIGIDAMLIQTSKETKSLYYLQVGMQQLLQMHEQLLLHESDSERVNQWNQQNQLLLPNAHGEIKQQNRITELQLVWQSGMKQQCKSNNVDMQCLAIEVPRS